jgi:hypothetical protein
VIIQAPHQPFSGKQTQQKSGLHAQKFHQACAYKSHDTVATELGIKEIVAQHFEN